ncbi:TolC family protein [Phocaeicola sp.]
MKRIDILFFIFMLCVPSATFAQQSDLLEKYRSMAVDYNHDLKAADKNIAASIELEKAAQKDLRPKLSGDANFQFTGNPIQLTLDLPSMQNPLTFEGRDMKYGASLTLLQPVYTGGRLLENIRMAKHQHSMAAHQAEYFRSAVCFQTDMQYWNTVARAEIVRVATDYRNSIASLAQTIRERVEVGWVDPQDLLMAEVKLNEAEYQLLQAKSNLETGRMALNSLIGVELRSATEVDDTIPSVVIDNKVWSSDGTDRPELKMAYDRIRIAESSKKLTDSKYKPQLYIGAEGSYSSPGYNFKSDLDPNYAVYAKLSVPLFEWGKRRNEKRASSFHIGSATDNMNQVSDQVNLEVQTARISLSQALEQVRLTESSLEKTHENERMALERYAEGKVSVVEVIEAQNYRQVSQTNHVQAKVSAQGYYSELMRALNKY